ncbi:uncharacterized protein V1518DRAFT_448718 [Limtongia smithiae]|uniref:uncharacterized protein n=1 Tax=Limtongia smithiae TaxID=1125753 RepID=UPI0034CFEB10
MSEIDFPMFKIERPGGTALTEDILFEYLQPRTEISSEIIDAWVGLRWNKLEQDDLRRKNDAIFPSCFLTDLQREEDLWLSGKSAKEPKLLLSNIYYEALLHCRRVYIPAHVILYRPGHFILLVVSSGIGTTTRRWHVRYLDSNLPKKNVGGMLVPLQMASFMQGSRYCNLFFERLVKVALALRWSEPRINFAVVACPQQDSTYNCGLFVLGLLHLYFSNTKSWGALLNNKMDAVDERWFPGEIGVVPDEMRFIIMSDLLKALRDD